MIFILSWCDFEVWRLVKSMITVLLLKHRINVIRGLSIELAMALIWIMAEFMSHKYICKRYIWFWRNYYFDIFVEGWKSKLIKFSEHWRFIWFVSFNLLFLLLIWMLFKICRFFVVQAFKFVVGNLLILNNDRYWFYK